MKAIIIFVGCFFTIVKGRTERIFKSGKGCGTTKPIRSSDDLNDEEECTMMTVHSQDLGETSNKILRKTQNENKEVLALQLRVNGAT